MTRFSANTSSRSGSFQLLKQALVIVLSLVAFVIPNVIGFGVWALSGGLPDGPAVADSDPELGRIFRGQFATILEARADYFQGPRGMISSDDLVILGAAGVSAAVVSYVSARYLSRKFVKMGITGNDIHKQGKPVTAEMGGISVLLGLLVGASVIMIGRDDPQPFLIAGIATVAGSSLVGVVDDFTNMRQRYKPFLIAATAIPLMYVLWSRDSIPVPPFGALPMGILYPLAVVPLAVAISANFSNMLAGFNGLEAGCATIAIGSLAFLAAVEGSYAAAAIGVILAFGFVGFLKLNWYPSKIFPGDAGTLMAGAGVATVALLAGLEFAAIIVSIPAGIDFTLKMVAKRPFGGRFVFGNTTVDERGHLKPPSYAAVVHAFMRSGPITERGLVISVLGMQGVYAALAIGVTLLGWSLHLNLPSNLRKERQIKKIWVAMSTPFQANFFAPLIEELQSEYDFFVTVREHDGIGSILKAKKIDFVTTGKHGGKRLENKLEAYAETIQLMLPLVEKEKPDLLLTERWPEAVRVAFGLNIPAWAIFYDERETHVNQMVFPLATKIFVPKFYTFQELYQYGVTDLDKIIWFNGFHTGYLKDAPISNENPFKKAGIDSRVVLVRPEPEFASFFPNYQPILEKSVDLITKNSDATVAVFPRTEKQHLHYSRQDKVVVIDSSFHDSPVAHADVALGAAETMLMEAFVLGKPAVSAIYWEPSKPVHGAPPIHPTLHRADPNREICRQLSGCGGDAGIQREGLPDSEGDGQPGQDHDRRDTPYR